MRIDATGGIGIKGLVPEGLYEGSLARSAWKRGISTVPSRRVRCDRAIVAVIQTDLFQALRARLPSQSPYRTEPFTISTVPFEDEDDDEYEYES
jgi:hypothetical protein